MSMNAVAITGVGFFSGVAGSSDEFREAILSGKSGIGAVDLFDVSSFPSRIAAQVRNYDPLAHFSGQRARQLSRTDQFALIAAREAVSMSRVSGVYNPYDVGVCLGGGAAGMLQAEQWLSGHISGQSVSPGKLRGVLPDRTTTEVARSFGFGGYQGTITTACSSSATAIGWGADLIRKGRQQAMLCGGADSLALLTFAGFNSLKVVDSEPCSPFSLGRQGISLGEGAAFVMLEDAGRAISRGADILGYLLGYSIAGEAYHMTAPEPAGQPAARVMRQAMESAGTDIEEIGWVNAHGTGTPLNDVVESNAMKLVFGGDSISVPPLVSTKPMTGHCLGAAGSIEAVATILSLNLHIIPRTLNFRGKDPDCDLDYCHDSSRPTGCNAAISNSFAFGGNITSLVLGSKFYYGGA